MLKFNASRFSCDFFSFFLFLLFNFSNLLLHANHTVCTANVPEMITEDYLSDMEEGIILQIFLLTFCVSVSNFFTLFSHICAFL